MDFEIEDEPNFDDYNEPDEQFAYHEENFEDDDEDDFEPAEIRTAILVKNDMIALLGVKTAQKGGTICRIDPREAMPAVQLYDNPEKAVEWYRKSLQTSKRNGWQVVYAGLPLIG